MKIQELNHAEMQQVNGGLLGLDGLLGGGSGNNSNLLTSLANGLGLNLSFSSIESGNENTGSYFKSNSFSLGGNLLSNILGGSNS